MEKKWYAADTAVMVGNITVAENVIKEQLLRIAM